VFHFATMPMVFNEASATTERLLSVVRKPGAKRPRPQVRDDAHTPIGR
jgi:hypothetical protein